MIVLTSKIVVYDLEELFTFCLIALTVYVQCEGVELFMPDIRGIVYIETTTLYNDSEQGTGAGIWNRERRDI